MTFAFQSDVEEMDHRLIADPLEMSYTANLSPENVVDLKVSCHERFMMRFPLFENAKGIHGVGVAPWISKASSETS